MVTAGGVGTGFVLQLGNDNYFVTAKHVLFDVSGNFRSPTIEILSQDERVFDPQKWKYRILLKAVEKAQNLYVAPDHDICAFKISERVSDAQVKTAPGVVLMQRGPTGTKSIVEAAIVEFEDVAIGIDVYIYGYPLSLGLTDLKGRPQPEKVFDTDRPLVRRGIVGGLKLETRTIILDCPAFPGNSGGPVLQARSISATEQNHELIGVVSKFVPYLRPPAVRGGPPSYENSGYAVAVSIDVVISIIKDASAHRS
jgi:S1-C subfamily serine protease